jgi:hypothetical protein
MENFNKLTTVKNSNYGVLDGSVFYVNSIRMYLGYFGDVPSVKRLSSIDLNQAKAWVECNLGEYIFRTHIKEKSREKRVTTEYKDIIYVLQDNVIIDIEDNGCVVVLHNEKGTDKAEEILIQLMQFKKRNKKTTDIGFVVSSTGGLTVVDSKIRKPKLNIHRHYNDDLAPLHSNVLKQLRTKNKNGLILFHGIPGTGKSTYIRYLIHCQSKRVIFMPTGIARNLESPELISLLIENPNSVLVIEDAEDLLTSRETNLNSGISMLLNLTDGLLGESLGIQVICTFNTKIENIDKALLRKGRLMAMYDFKPLAAQKANDLLRELNAHKPYTDQPMTLAEIFNIQEEDFDFSKARKQKIGFALEQSN